MTLNENLFGIVFRFKDEYNFYALQIHQTLGFKSLVRVSNGKFKKLAEVRVGGIYQNEWFKVQIVVKNSNIVIRFGQDKNFQKYSSLPIIFNLDDNVLSVGRYINIL